MIWRKPPAEEEVSPPRLPENRHFYCYWLSMEDLLGATQGEEEMAKELQRMLHGGYDLLALEKDCALGKHYGSKEAKNFEQAASTLRNEKNKRHTVLKDEEHRLPELENKLKEAKKAATYVKMLAKAVEWKDANQSFLNLKKQSRTYPKEHRQIYGNELEGLFDLAKERNKLDREMDKQNIFYEEAQTALQKLGNLAMNPASDMQIDKCKKWIDDLRILNQNLEQLESSYQKIKIREKQASEALGNKISLAEHVHLNPEDVGKAEEFARCMNALLTNQQKLQQRSQQRKASDDVSEGEVLDVSEGEVLLVAEEHLLNWLSVPDEQSSHCGTIRFTAMGVALVLAIGASLFLSNITAMVPIIPLLLVLLLELKDKEGSKRRHARSQFEACGVQPAPRPWQTDEVRTCLKKVRNQRISWLEKKLRHHQAREQAKKDAYKLNAIGEKIRDLEKENCNSPLKLGFEPMQVIAFYRFIMLVKQLDKAKIKKADCSEKITQTKNKIHQKRKAIRSFLSEWMEKTYYEYDTECIAQALEYLRRRVDSAQDLQSKNTCACEAIQRIKQQLESLGGKENALYQKLGINPEAENRHASLKYLLDKHENWKKVQHDLKIYENLVTKLKADLEQYPDVFELAKLSTRNALETQRQTSTKNSDGIDNIKEEITQIRTRSQEAEKGTCMATWKTKESEALMQLEDKFDQAILRHTKSLLLEDIRTERKTEHEPQAIKDADTLLQRFTHSKFSLELDEEGQFRARDQLQDKTRRLEELSTATRMQFLISARIAWMRQIEGGGEALPIFLDEALTTSDEGRFSVMAQTLTELSHSEDRQFFYLTARLAEANFWQATVKGYEVQHIDLAKTRGEREAIDTPSYALKEHEAMPTPDGHTPKSYAKILGVESINPWKPATTHLFHLFQDDLQLLHNIIDGCHMEKLGQLENCLRKKASTKSVTNTLGSDEKVSKVRLRCAIAKSWMGTWKDGKDQPLASSLLRESQLVSENFQKKICAQCEKLRGDARGLIKWLKEGKVRCFGNKKIDRLETWLRAQGHIVEKPEKLDPSKQPARRLEETLKSFGATQGGEPSETNIPTEVKRVVSFLEKGTTLS